MGIHRINLLFVEEFGSPGDLRFRIETDIRMPKGVGGRGFVQRLRNAVASSQHERARDLLLERLQKPIPKRRERVTAADLVRVRRLVTGALSAPGRSLPGDPPRPRAKKPG
ncbi:MAG TPA: hypothetical protein VFU23_16130 [Gemmatimonadales bacterium]|nr:hypothetical protein [Gemmatimonadales bacterium]